MVKDTGVIVVDVGKVFLGNRRNVTSWNNFIPDQIF